MLITNRDIIQKRDYPNHLYFRKQEKEYRLTPWAEGFELEYREKVRIPTATPMPLPGLADAATSAPPLVATARWVSPLPTPDLLLISLKDFNRGYKTHSYLHAIPRRFRDAAEPFTYMQYSVLRLMRLSPYGLQFLKTNPLLAWFLAIGMARGRVAPDEIADLIRMRQNKIVRTVFDPDTSVTWKLFSKFSGSNYSRQDYKALTAFLGDKRIVKSLRHYAACPMHGIRILSQQPRAVQLKSIRGLMETTPYAPHLIRQAFITFRDALAIGTRLNIDDPFRRLKQVPDLDALLSLHDTWSRDLALKEDRETNPELYEAIFPAPPIPGDSLVQHIDNYYDLRKESEELHHCVRHYVDQIREGKSYIYRVMRPERGTLELKGRRGKAYVNQFSLYKNASPSAESKTFIEQWVKRGNASELNRLRQEAAS